MNRIYRLVFNRALCVMQVASELAASGAHGSATGTGTRYRPRHALALACALALPGAAAWAATPTVDTAQPFYDESSTPLQQNPVVFDGGIFKPTTGFSLSAPVTLDMPGGYIDSTNGIVYLNGAISGPGGLTIMAGHGVALTTANTYSGGTTINSGGILGIQNTLAALPGNVVDNGYLQLEATTGTYAGTISGQGSVQVVALGGGTLVLTGNNTAAGSLVIYDSTVQLGAGGTTGSWGGSNIGVASSLVFDRSDTVTYSGQIMDFNGGHGSLTQAGTGTLILAGNNSYSGGTTISAGTLQLGNGGYAGSISGSVVDNGKLVFDLSSGSTLSGAITGTGSVQQIGSGTTSLLSTNTYSGGTTISAGTLQVMDASSLGTGAITIGNASLSSSSALIMNSAINVNGNAVISAAGGMNLAGAVSGSGSLTTNSSTFTTAANMLINGPLSVTSTAGGIVQAGGLFTISGASTFNAGASSITLTGLNAFGGAVSLTGGTTQITNFGNLTLGALNTGALTAVNLAGALNLGSGTVNGALTATTSGSLSESGGLDVTGPSSFSQNGSGVDVDLSLANDFHGGVTISGASINNLSLKNIDAAPGALTLPTGVAGNLTLNYTNAALTVPLMAIGGNLDVSAGGGITIDGSVTTGGAQAYNDAVTLGANTALTSGPNGAINFGSTVDGAYSLVVNSGGRITFGGAVGGTTALTSLATTAAGSTALYGNVTTLGAQTYNSAVTLGADTMLVNSNGGISLAATVDGAHALTVNSGGSLSFAGAVGSNTALSSLTTNSATVVFDSLNISHDLSMTTGGVIAQGAGTLSVGGNSWFNASGGAISLNSVTNRFSGDVSLTTGGNFAASVNNGSNPLALGNVSVGGALTVLYGGSLTLDGDVSFNGALSVGTPLVVRGLMNGGAVALTNSGSGGITFAGTVDGAQAGAENLSVNGGSAGVTFGGDVGGVNALGSLTVNSAAVVGGKVNTSGAQTYNGALMLSADTTLASSGGPIDLGSTLDGAHSLSVNTSGVTTLGGAIGDTTTLTSISVLNTAGSTTLNGGAISTTGAQTYANAVTLGADTTLSSNSGGAILLGGSVYAAHDLTVNSASTSSGIAGSIFGAGSLIQSGGGTLTLDGNSSAFTGSTEAQSGKLVVGSMAGNGAVLGGNVQVDSGATLAGHGTIGGSIDVASGAHLAPGNSIGTLTIGGDAVFAQGSVLDYEFGAPGASFTAIGTGDSVKVGGNLTLNGATLNVTDAGGFGPGLYNLFTYGGSLTETHGGITLGTTPAGDSLVIQVLTAAKQVNLLNATGLTLNLWNGNGLAGATQMGGGTGIWSMTSSNWTDATGSVSAPMQPQPGFGIFGGAAGTVTVDNSVGNVSATGMQFGSNGYTLAGGALSLVGSGGSAPIIRVGDGSSAGAGFTATINSVLAGTDGLIKSDLGTLVLSGANTYSGGTTINGGTLEAANNAALGTDSVTVDNTANQGATLKVDSGITLANTIAINNGGSLDNAGTISHTAPTDIGVQASGGMATITNHDGGSIAGGSIGLWLHTGGTVTNTGNASSISGINYAIVTDGNPGSSVTNENGASIHSSMTDAVLMIQSGTLTNDSGANISGNVGVRLSQGGTVTNEGGASINGTTNSNGTGVGVVLMQGGTVTNQGGASISGTGMGVALQGGSSVVNAAGSSISGPDASVMAFGSGAVNLTNAGTLTGSVLLDGSAANRVTLFSGSVLTGALNIGGNLGSQLTLDGSGTQLYSAAVTGNTTFAGTLIKQGGGTWIVDSALAPAETIISSGTLQIGSGGASGSLAGNISNNGALVVDLGVPGTLSGAISGTGSLSQNGSGVVTLTGANTYSGGTTIHAGTLQGDTSSLQGDITDDSALVFKQNTAGTFAGVVSGTGSLTQAGNGTLTLTGANTYGGGTTIAHGVLQVGNGGTTGSIVGNVADNGVLVFNRSDNQNVNGAISGTGSLMQAGPGTLTLTGANSYTGGTTIGAGTLQIGNGGTSGSIVGNVVDNGTFVFNRSDAVSYSGAISGSGALVKYGAGVLTLAGANTYSGGTTINAGTLQGDSTSLQGNITDNATLVFNQGSDGSYSGVLAGSGSLVKSGAGTLLLTGIHPFTGSTVVQAGTLEVGDASSSTAFLGGNIAVAAGGTLRGHGTIGGDVVNDGTLRPGGSIGTLTVAGNVTQNADGVLAIDTTANGQASLLAVQGKATIMGGSAVALAQSGQWAPRTDYTILTAAGGITGTFTTVSSSLAFLTPVLAYSPSAVTLSLQRNDISFASVAQTPNQRAVASAIEPLGFGDALYSALVVQDAATARDAFNQLSGDIYASTRTALIDDSRYVRDAINRHLLGVSNGADGAQGSTDTGVTAWTSGWGHWGDHDDDGNASRLQANGSGLLIGADVPLSHDARLGAVAGHGQNSLRVSDAGSSAHATSTVLGLYGSVVFDAFALRGGVAYAWQDVDSTRQIAFGNYRSSLSGTTHAHTAQAFAEGDYRFNVSSSQQLAPFLNIARVQLQTNALSESGNAALAVAGNSSTVNTATLGLRDTLNLDATGGFYAHGSLGWQQAWGDLTPLASMRLAAGSASFGIAGVPLAQHALVMDAGASFRLGSQAHVDVSYIGQFASHAKDQGARMSLQIDF